MKRVAFHTIGCKLNQFETEFMREQFEKRGWSVVPFGDIADVYVINTCTVTSKADSKSRQSIRQAKRRNPSSLVVAVGCYPQVYSEDLLKLEADIIAGNKEKLKVVELVDEAIKNRNKIVKIEPLDGLFHPMAIEKFSGYSRAFVKIQDGCDKRCTYCVVWMARGPSRSAPVDFILDEVKRLVSSGYEEIVLTGTNIGDYGKKEGLTLITLLERLSNVEGLKKIRLSSIEPVDVTDDFIGFVRNNPKICRHLHIPVQSVSDRILSLMGRDYNEKFLRKLFEKIFTEIPDVGVGVDIIVGFPTETEEDFNKTFKFIEDYPIYYMHIFSYSSRPKSKAFNFRPKVRPDIIRKRWEMLNELKSEKKREFVSKFVGKTLMGTVESRPFNDTYWSAISENYIQLLVKEDLSDKAGRVLSFKGICSIEDKLIVELVEG